MKSGGGFDVQQREIFEKRRLELVALGKVSAAETSEIKLLLCAITRIALF